MQTIDICDSQDRDWHAVYATSRHERVVRERISAHAIETFLPTYPAIHRWRNGCTKKLDLPLFPNYLFVHIARNERKHVLQVPGVIGLVGTGAGASPIPVREIEALRHSILNGTCEPHPGLAVGAKVRIRTGAMEGLVGILTRIKGNFRVVISLNVIMRSFAVEIDMADVEILPGQRLSP